MNRAQLTKTRRETIHGGSTPASMRVMVVANCARSPSLAVNKTAVNVARLSKDHAKNLNLVSFTTVPQIIPGDMDRKQLAETVSRRDADAEPPRTGSRRVPVSCFRFMSVVNNGFSHIHWHRGMNCGTVVDLTPFIFSLFNFY